MQRNSCKINESHLNTIALKARMDNTECGYLWKKSSDGPGKWQMKWFALYQNMLFYYENVNCVKPQGLLFVESCDCHRVFSNSVKGPASIVGGSGVVGVGSAGATANTANGNVSSAGGGGVSVGGSGGMSASVKESAMTEIKLFCFCIIYSKEKEVVELGASTEEECAQWIESIVTCGYNRQVSLNAELNQKYLHLNQLFETEVSSKWEKLAQIESLSSEVKQLREELAQLSQQKKRQLMLRQATMASDESPELKRIRKVQSLCKGWLYRKRWKRIVKEYIESPDAKNLRKRNRIVFELVEKEGEYMGQLEVLVANFLRPFKMAACSSKAPITHEEVNCIFLNSEILLFLHQIFYKGLRKKLENWPTLFIGDLFDFLLPVLAVYQEYVRNHHYSLQILTDLKSKSLEFRNLLMRYEAKCDGRSLDVYLTYPMHQIPRYILILHELIAHTSTGLANELRMLENAKKKLEELSRIMHDEVSETENIRCNLAIEKTIVEGCDCLLDVSQVFIREGLLIALSPKSKSSSVKLKDVRKRHVVKCFLFSNHLIVTTRAPNGRLNLFKPYQAIPLNECRVVEDITNEFGLLDDENKEMDDRSLSSASFISNAESTLSLFFSNSKTDSPSDLSSTSEFKLVQTNSTCTRSIHFIASSIGEKQSWCGDISQCIDNLNYSKLFHSSDKSNSVNMPNKEAHVGDPKLFKDEKDVKYSKHLNSCKVPQIRQATAEKLIERLTDLRFLSIDFLNTFLLTYRLFTNSLAVLKALRDLYECRSTVHSPTGTMVMATTSNGICDIYEQASLAGGGEDEAPRSPPACRVVSSNHELQRRVSVSGCGLFRLPSINEEHDLHMYVNSTNLQQQQQQQQHSQTQQSRTTPPPTTTTTTHARILNKSKSPVNLAARASIANGECQPTTSLMDALSSSSSSSFTRKSSLPPQPSSSTSNERQQQPFQSKLQQSSLTPQTPPSTPQSQRNNNNKAKPSLIHNVMMNVTRNVTDGIIFGRGELDMIASPASGGNINQQHQSRKMSNNSTTSTSTVETALSGDGAGNAAMTDLLSQLNCNVDESICSVSERANSIGSLNVSSFLQQQQQQPQQHSSHQHSSRRSNSSAAAIPPAAVEFFAASSSCPTPSLSSSINSSSSKTSTGAQHRYSPTLTTSQLIMAVQQNAQKISKRLSDVFVKQSEESSAKAQANAASKAATKQQSGTFAGVIVTSSRLSRRRTSNLEATTAFAVATSGSQLSLSDTRSTGGPRMSNAPGLSSKPSRLNSTSSSSCGNDASLAYAGNSSSSKEQQQSYSQIVITAASMRVLNILRHWMTKHPFDFDNSETLREETLELVEQMLTDPELTETERKVALAIVKQLHMPLEKRQEQQRARNASIESLLTPPAPTSPLSTNSSSSGLVAAAHIKVKFNELSVSEIAEQMTYIDYQILCSISCHELLGQAWMKPGKEDNAPHVLMFSKRFNQMSQLVVTEIVSCATHEERLEKLEKWTTIANICKFLKNFNGVLQIMSAFATTSVFRLKKTWDKLSKNSQQTIETLQALVSSDGRFKNLRDAMRKCDPPSIPYLGMYLMDLVFIEESTPDFLEDDLINFSKLRMVSHIIRDVRTFQQIKYTIHHNKRVCDYLLDTSGILSPDEAYNMSLTLEPRTSLNRYDSKAK